jgi:hypothetical protein
VRVPASVSQRATSYRIRLAPWGPANVVRCGRAYLLDRRGRSAYTQLDEAELRAGRRSDTVFVFGSGKSLLDLDDADWARIAAHDTVGFSQFQEQDFVRVDYHLISEAHDIDRYARLFGENKRYASTVYAVQEGWLAQVGNEIVGRRLLPHGAPVFRFTRTARGVYAPPSESFSDGLVHGSNSSISTTNFALLAGWTRIVLTGIDLYDREYFYLPPGGSFPGEKPGYDARSRFPGADATIEHFRRWRPLLEARGIELLVYNPRSLLAGALDVFSWDRIGTAVS